MSATTTRHDASTAAGAPVATVTVRPLAVDDDAELAAVHAALTASSRHERPWAKVWSLRELTVQLRTPSTLERLEAFVAEVDGLVAGASLVWFPLLDNTAFTWAELDVDPALRGRGAGSALLARVVERTREEGRATVLFETHVPDGERETHGHVRFLQRHGFTHANTEIRRILDLPLDPAQLAELASGAAPHHEGYRVESHPGGLPEHLRASYCDCWNQLAVDAPTGEIDFEAESLTPQTYAEELDRLRAQGRTMLHTVAVAPTGEVVAYNDLVVSADDPDDVMQWGTLVRREHRGHRLGMAVKVRGLQELARLAPEARRVQTCNAEQNAHMVGVNVALGFRKVEALMAFQRHLAQG
ncbi:MAG TPA: GNAT family N-acetyltransferase [Pedococcus sp.]|jgi:GNAT superfamily N-acetyltransferase|uniref:GNAT family N-acetyltransferase n=1 Tax=Pedococcus sp. TaxID=2860345 RepID=UPI002F92E61B